jgi:hypothetical protein
MTLPRALRNWLAEVILASFSDLAARRELEAIAALPGVESGSEDEGRRQVDREAFGWHRLRARIGADGQLHAPGLAERAERARQALDGRPVDPSIASLPLALTQAAVLFDARLYFEVHERLEPYWKRAEGYERAALQGLIQVAAGLHHLDNGNIPGACSLLHDGIARLPGQGIEHIALDSYARDLRRCLDDVKSLDGKSGRRFDWSMVPRFPRASQ